MANPATRTPQRIVVVGCTGVGKSVLAATIAEHRLLPFVELDAHFWLPDWQTPDPDDFRACVRDATSGEGWVVAGNYDTRLGSLVWGPGGVGGLAGLRSAPHDVAAVA